MTNKFLIYGANGYTGELITRFAAERGMKPILAGRNETKIANLAGKYGLEYRIFALDDTAKLNAALEEVEMVLHCAGPFSLTSRPVVEACLRNKKHYTDITGEIAVFETCAATDKKALAAGVMLMPGVGFDVVPSDCLARHLKDRLPSATHLSLAFYGIGRLSHGTQATMTMNVGKDGAIRKDGKITSVPPAWKTREIDFGEVKKTGVTIPWGDVATAYYSTGIPNIEVFTVVPPSNLRMLKMSRYSAVCSQPARSRDISKVRSRTAAPVMQNGQKAKRCYGARPRTIGATELNLVCKALRVIHLQLGLH